MRKIIVIILFLGALNNIITAQGIVTDRHDQTESSSTVPANSLQIEMGFGSGNFDSKRLSLFPTALFRYGLSKNIELRFVEQLAGFDNSVTSEPEFGLSDIEVGLKIQVLKKRG